MPSGGVSRPKDCVITTITPRCTGWIPTATASGWMIGTKIRMAGSASMNVPSSTFDDDDQDHDGDRVAACRP